ncbi:mucin-1-like isoform X2 [Lethenteron reissneri]|uniref:mucin-1-like isoform X2 n=1 Tax=Lethenteron reissneri TaxID=7753 RepID=UPI002AB5E5AF|nr:mucin-1-like isoform X2 [Lethenteron reissneri]
MRDVVVLLVVIVLVSWCSAAPDYNYDDDDETTQEPDVCGSCHVNATCMTKDEALKCVCNKGLSGNGKSACRDNDECRLDVEMLCGTGTSCFNTFGSFYCRCAAGYLSSSGKRDFEPNDGTTCADVDECAGGITACGAGASCENRPGAFACRCLDGYVATNGTEPFQPGRDGTFCVRVATLQPPTTRPPSTRPPTMRPPTTRPPTMRPPTTRPPTTRPPTTRPPSTMPPSTMPPSTMPPTTMPQTTRPQTTRPPSTRPQTTRPPTMRPPTTRPPTTRPPTTMPQTTRPPSTRPQTTRPPTTRPPTTRPSIFPPRPATQATTKPSLSPTDKEAAIVDASLTDLDCNAPPELNGTRVKQVGKGPGAIAHYRCIDEPEAQAGQWSLVCSTNGTWQGQQFLCSGARKSPSGAKVAGVLALVVAAAASAVAGLVFLKKSYAHKCARVHAACDIPWHA